MPKNSSLIINANKILIIITTFLVVIGIVTVGYILTDKKSGKPENEQQAEETQGQSERRVSFPFELIMPNESAVSIFNSDGKIERLSFDEFNNRYKDTALPAAGALAANGEIRYLHFPLGATSTVFGQAAPDGKSTARLGPASKDGAGIVVIKKTQTKEEKIVLRTAQNKPIKDAMLLGWFDENNMVVIASADQKKYVYAVNLNGVIKQILELPENAIYYAAKGGYFWYTTGTLGEGLETPPKGPSELLRLSLNGVSESAVKDEKKTFISVVSGPANFLAVTTNDGYSFITQLGSGQAKVEIGKQRPLLFAKNGKLIARDGFDLVLIDSATGLITKLTTLPEGLAEVYIYHEE